MITAEILKQHNLNQEEYQKIVAHMGREPNLVELGIFSVMWSEHCSYKSSRKFLKGLPTKAPFVMQGPGENAGIIDIGDGLALAFKIESHNHPSFIEPYNGAATGVGGILRDVFTMGARPIAILDSLRFGEVSHPKTAQLVKGVVAGIAGYGNCIGIPTVGGEVSFDACYNGNNLVNAMAVGLVAHDRIFKGFASGVGNPVMYIGSKTGRDGIHGATMASDSFDDKSEQKKPTVQVGDPFTEKLLLEACIELMQTDVVVGIQDMGAAGLTSSSVEMASRAGTGLVMNLDKVPLREEGMTPYEIMLSESQERMLVVVKKGYEQVIIDILTKWDLDASVIGEVTSDGFLRLNFHGEEVASLPVAPLTDGAPLYDRPRKRPAYLDSLQSKTSKDWSSTLSLSDAFKKIISDPSIASKKWVYQQYDYQVMTQTVTIPGSDAAVIRIKGTNKGVAMTVNCNSRYCYLDPFAGMKIAIAESGRNLACSGAKPMALTDCLNFGNPIDPEIMWQFVESITGMSEACKVLGTPVIGGNVSFYNETNGKSIYPTPTIGMVGLLENVADRVESFFKNEGDVIYLLGETKEELGGSQYLATVLNKTEGRIPELNLERERMLWNALLELSKKKLLVSAHDCSEGGLAITLAECSFGRNGLIGSTVDVASTLRAEAILFSETQSRVVVSINPADSAELENVVGKYGLPLERLGTVGGNRFVVKNKNETLLDLPLGEMNELWEKGFEKGVFGE